MRGVIATLSVASVSAAMLVASPQASVAQDRSTVQPLTSAACAGIVNPAGAAFAQGRVTHQGSNVAGARVHAFDVESGRLACVTTAADGTYTLPLPGVPAGGATRRPADGWVIAVSAPSGQTLGGTSRVLTWDAVALGGTLADTDLTLGEATVVIPSTATSVTGTFSALVCTGRGEVEMGGTCGIATVNSSSPLRLATGSSGYQWLSGWAMRSGTWWRGYGEFPSQSESGADPVVTFEEEYSSNDCGSEPSFAGQVSREVDGATGPVAATVQAYAVKTVGSYPQRYWLSGAGTDRLGRFTLCMSTEYANAAYLTGAQLYLVASSVNGGVRTVSDLPRPCLTSCADRDVRLSTTASIGGRFTLQGATPQRPASFANWWLYRGTLRNESPYLEYDIAYGTADADGRWGLAFAGGVTPVPNGTYVVTGNAGLIREGYADAVADLTVTSSSGSRDVVVPLANFVGRALNPDGSPVRWSWMSISEEDCNDCRSFGSSLDDSGWFSAKLPDGTFIATLYPQWDDTVTVVTRHRLEVRGGVLTSFMGAAPAAPLIFPMQRANAEFLVSFKGQPLAGTNINLLKWSTTPSSSGYDWSSYSWRYTGSSGRTADFLTDGSYRVGVTPSIDSLASPLIQGWRVTTSPSGVSISVCTTVPAWGQDPCPPSAPSVALPRSSDGAWRVDVPAPNLIATVTSPSGDRAVPYASVCLDKLGRDDQATDGASWCTNSTQAGMAGLTFSGPGRYAVRIAKPWDLDEDWVPSTFTFEVSDSNAICLRQSSTLCTSISDTEVVLPLRGPNILANVLGAQGGVITAGWASVQKSCQAHPNCMEWVGYAHVSNRGSLSFRLPASDDTYYVRVQPYEPLSDGSTATTFQFQIADPEQVQRFTWQLRAPNVSGTIKDWEDRPLENVSIQVERSTGSTWSWVDAYAYSDSSGQYRLLLDSGTYRLRLFPGNADRERASATVGSPFTVGSANLTVNQTMTRPNLVGTLMSPDDTVMRGAWINIQKWYPAYGYYGWSSEISGLDTSSQGRFAGTLPSGRWRLVVNAPWGDMVASQTIVPLDSDGTGVCLDTGGGCSAGQYLDTSFVVTMKRANASGRAVMPDGTGTVSYAWIDVRRWSALANSFVWDFDLPSVSTGPDASFAMRLPKGRWQLTAWPGNGVIGGTRNAIDVTVDDTGVCLTTMAPCDADDSIAPGQMRIALRAPNVNGTVSIPGETVANAWVYAERWVPEWGGWNWADAYGWTSATGSYGLSVTQDGAYRVTVRPSNGGVRGHTAGMSYVLIAAGKVCELTAPPTSGVEPSCPGGGQPIDDTVTLSTPLPSANLVAEVRGEVDGINGPLSWLWTHLQRWTGSWWSGVAGASTIEDGSVSYSVTADDTELYRLRVEPPWGASDLVRTYAEFVAYRSSPSSPVMTCRSTDWDSTARTCQSPVTDDTPLRITMATGAVKGLLTTPDDTPVAGAWVSVERWSPLPWDANQSTWQWEDAYTYSRDNGRFALSVQGPATFRLTAYPRWPNLEGLARAVTVVSVDSNGKWCTKDDSTGTSPALFDGCETGWQEATALIPLRYRTSNVVGGLVFNDTVDGVVASRGMPYGWVSVQDSSGRWVTSTGTSDQGRFSLLLERDGNYTLIGYPNWAFSQRPPVLLPIQVAGGNVVGGEVLLDFDAVIPNVVLTLTGITGPRFIGVEQGEEVGGVMQWTSVPEYTVLSKVGASNQARLKLPPGRYRLSVVPDIGQVLDDSGSNISWVEVTVADPGFLHEKSLSATELPAPPSPS